MKAYSLDFRSAIVKAYLKGDASVRKVAERFNVSKSLVQKLIKQQSQIGHVRPKKQGGRLKSLLWGCERELDLMVEKLPDATLSEYCEYWGETYERWVSNSTMCRALIRRQLTRKKRGHGVAVARQPVRCP